MKKPWAKAPKVTINSVSARSPPVKSPLVNLRLDRENLGRHTERPYDSDFGG